MDPLIKSDCWNIWTRKDADGDTVDVTDHPTVRFAEYNSIGTDGALLAVPGEITLGTMDQAVDLEKKSQQLRTDMKLDLWTPAVPETAVYIVTLEPNGGTVMPAVL